MTPAPLSVVIEKVAEISKYHPVRNRDSVVKIINGVISMLFRTPALRYDYFKVDDCTVVCRFDEACLTNRCPSFLGVVMPPLVQNIREIRINDTKFEITKSRVAGPCYERIGRNCRPKAEHLTPRILERDIPCTSNGQVSFRSDSDQDCGKIIGLRYVDKNGREERTDLVLSTAPVLTPTSVHKFLEITFPRRCGWMTVETADGDSLGRYHPSIYSPKHEWFRLQAGCIGTAVNYLGLREPYPLVFDTDMVPFSDDTLWTLAYPAYQNLGNMELTAGQVNALSRIYSQLNAVTTEDSAGKNLNFNKILLPESGRTMLSTGRLMSRTPR
jgi:hypothetical protein